MMKRYGRISAHLSKHSLARISAEFAVIYLLAGCIMGFLYCLLGTILPQTVFSFNHGPLCLTQAIYFSSILFGPRIAFGCGVSSLAHRDVDGKLR
jgi:hypothetical protein